MILFLEFTVWNKVLHIQHLYVQTHANLQMMLQFQETSNTETSSVAIRLAAHTNACCLLLLLLLPP
jgi:hypothetical protein